MPVAPPTPAVTSKNVFGNCQVSSWRAKLSPVGELRSYCGATRADRSRGPSRGREALPRAPRRTLGSGGSQRKRSLARAGRDVLKQAWSGGVPRIPAGLPKVHICRKTIHAFVPQIIWVPRSGVMPWTEVRTSLTSCTPAGSTRAMPAPAPGPGLV